MSDVDDNLLTLSDGAARVDLLPSLGGRIAQVTVGSRVLLRGPEHAALGWPWWGSYPMLPWANRIAGGVAPFRGDAITVPVNWPDGTAIHGLAYEAPWDVAAAAASAATLTIEVAVDRYRIGAEQRYALSAEALDLEIDVVNLAEWPVPAGIGIHPWFVSAPVRVPADLVWPGDGPMPTGPPRPVGPDEDLRQPVIAAPMDCCFTGLTGTSADIGDLTLSWRGPITQVVVYSGEPGFLCVEPQTMATDGFRLADEGVDGTGVIALEPGETLSVGYRLTWPPPPAAQPV
jgi:aldose 1-epimerase